MSRAKIAFACLFATAATPALAVRDTTYYTSLTVFGDSLVDAGNVFALTGGAAPAASNGYFAGRFTNGYDFTDLLSIDLFGAPTVASLNGGNNFAYGGALANSFTTDFDVPDLLAQLDLYKASGKAVDRNGLYVLNFGGNDIFAAQRFPAATPGDTIQAFLKQAADNIATGVATLNAAGVRNILVSDFPVASEYSLQANGYLTAALAGTSLDGDTTLLRFDTLGFLGRVQADPVAYGLAPFTSALPCQSGGAAAIANDCRGYFTLDGTHPVAGVQRAFYQDLNAQFGLNAAQAPVPEPAVWAMMVVGFGLVGAAIRRRRPAALTA